MLKIIYLIAILALLTACNASDNEQPAEETPQALPDSALRDSVGRMLNRYESELSKAITRLEQKMDDTNSADSLAQFQIRLDSLEKIRADINLRRDNLIVYDRAQLRQYRDVLDSLLQPQSQTLGR